MHLFKYRSGELYAEDVPVQKLAERYGTPLYIYSYNTLIRHFKAYDDAFNDYPHIICFAVNPIHILQSSGYLQRTAEALILFQGESFIVP